MRSQNVKTGENIYHNFKISPEISHWSIKYNKSIDEIQHIFNDCGNSIARTIEILRREKENSDQTGQAL
jgi:hypothetical protein